MSLLARYFGDLVSDAATFALMQVLCRLVTGHWFWIRLGLRREK